MEQQRPAGLTGELRLQDGRFAQVVEGRCADVLRLAARILADPRHGAIRILAFRALPPAAMPTWTVRASTSAPRRRRAPRPTPANLRFLQARAAARALELGLPRVLTRAPAGAPLKAA